MSKTYPVIERNGSRITVLARSAEEAHRAATEQLGSNCTIVSVERVRSGGLGGFFATELVRLVAGGRSAELEPVPPPTFANAEELMFALPGGGGEFAARLKEELAALTAQGTAAAEAMLAPARQQAEGRDRNEPSARRQHRELAMAGSVSAGSPADAPDPIGRDSAGPTATEPTSTLWTSRTSIADDESELSLPTPEELRWGSEEEPVRAWRRGSRANPSSEPADTVRSTDAASDAALAAAFIEADDPFAHVHVRFAAEPVEHVEAPAEAPAASFATEALVAQMLDNEYEFEHEIEDRPITARASLIRSGRALLASAIETSGGPIEDFVARSPIETAAAPDVAPAPAPEFEVAVEQAAPVSHAPEIRETPDLPEPHETPAVATAPPEPMVAAPVVTAPMAAPVAEPIAVLPAPAAPRRSLIVEPVSAASSWSGPTLRAFGVPDTVVERIVAHAPADDIEWTVSFMLAVRDRCRPVPNGPQVLTGPSGANLARQLGLGSVSGDELGASNWSVASPNAGPVTLRRSAADRRIHLVVGGNWHHLVTVKPDIVSAATDFDLLEALRVAEAWGATLGWTLDGDHYVRIDPYLLAGRVRDLLPSGPDPLLGGEPSLFAPFA